MADKQISSLPQAQTVDDSSLFVLEQQGTAMKATGAQWKGFAVQAVSQYVEPAQQAAQQAQQAAQQATTAVGQIGTAVEDTQANAEAAQDAQEAAEAAQTAAESAKAAAESAADGVEGYATAAEAAKNAAISAQTAAEQAEGNAESYATSASGSAQTAIQSAQDAQRYASTASGSATAASQSAADAQEAAELAQDAQDAIENLGVVGETLSPGEQVQVIKTVGEDGVVTLTFRIPQGLKGDTGDTGATGQTGPQGVSVVSAEIDDSGHLIITLSEGNPLDAGSAVGPQGEQGPQGPQGEVGPQGPEGPQGPKGDTGTGLDIKGTYDSLELLEAAVQSPQQGDMYNVGASAPYTIYMWDETSGTGGWVSQGQIQGAKGDTGPQGPQGEPGTPGMQGPAGADGQPGKDGGYYTPSVDDSGNLSWEASKKDMPAVIEANIRGPKGDPGADGEVVQQVYIGESEPVDENVDIWINPTGETVIVPTKTSELINDSGFISEENDPTVPNYVKNITQENINSWNGKSNFSGSYNDLEDKPTIPAFSYDSDSQTLIITG